MAICTICGGEGWVCEDHPDKAWGEGLACPCGQAGAPCICNPLHQAGMEERAAKRLAGGGGLEIRLYCICGDGLEAEVGGTPEALRNVETKVAALWKDVHKGAGHGPCSRKEAVQARARRERSGTA